MTAAVHTTTTSTKQHKKSLLIMDKRRPKCFHNGIILIVNGFQTDTKIQNK
jgi:aspartokinase